jgi:hypothetical protein
LIPLTLGFHCRNQLLNARASEEKRSCNCSERKNMKITKDSFALPGLLVGLIILIGILVYLGNESKRLAHENPVVLDSISSNVNHTVPAIPVK